MRSPRILLTALTILALTATRSMAQPGGDRPEGGRGGGRGGSKGDWSRGESGKSSRRSGGSSSSDPNDFFNKMADGKDTWKRSEITDPRKQDMFDRIATEVGAKNGEITRDQFVSYMNKKQAERAGGIVAPGTIAPAGTSASPGQSSSVYDRAAESSFRRYDKNGDGLLSYDEMPPELQAERDLWDKDHNGFIDLNEYKAYYIAKREQRRAEYSSAGSNFTSPRSFSPTMPQAPSKPSDSKPLVYTKQNLPKEIPSWFRDLDTDGDAQICLYEWRAAGRSLDEFRKYDLNNDGFITVDEVMHVVAGTKKPGDKTAGSKVAVSATFSPSGKPSVPPGVRLNFDPAARYRATSPNK